MKVGRRGYTRPMPDAPTTIELRVPAGLDGTRVDRALADLLPGRSRACIQRWLREGLARVDGRVVRPRERVSGGETVTIDVPAPEPIEWKPQPAELDVVHVDEEIIVVNKPAGVVVHPGAGNPDRTLVNALLAAWPELEALPRGGIVHRLDKDTSGLMVVARTDAARRGLAAQLAGRGLKREYEAIACGRLVAGGTVCAPIGRDSRDRRRMAVRGGGREAVSHYRVVARYRAHTRLRVSLETGRTHQVRVHLAHIGHPLLGDPTYGGRPRFPAGASRGLREAIEGFRRQALHAAHLALRHPGHGRTLSWTAPLPADMQALIEALEADAALHAGEQVAR